MAEEWPKNLSFWQKMLIAAAVVRALNTGIWAFILSPFRGKSGAKKLSKHIKLAMSRTFMHNLTIKQTQYINPINDSIYAAHAKKKGFAPEIITLEDGTRAHWIGNPKSEKVLLWYHGGGFTLPIDPGHFIFASSIVDSAHAAGKDIGILFVAYTLAPQAHYPRQLQQAVETLRHTLNTLNRAPNNIIVGGDSAGANLTLGVMSHILHPHPSIPSLQLSAPLKGAILMSPWASFATDWPSVKRNGGKDIVSSFLGDTWSTNFLGGAPRDQYNEPIRADMEWWNALKDVVDEIFTVGGGDEILYDSILETHRKLEAAHPKTSILMAEDEHHDQPVLAAMGPSEGQQADRTRSWITERL